jgi:hypothetical protein
MDDLDREKASSIFIVKKAPHFISHKNVNLNWMRFTILLVMN